ncbi:hypothetical protein CHS0354_020131 [Potamilus streckersoni]|uniref:SEFIR domain-containing protein n=1 Tax=Potamilus streckersoni TaxID=2493646 RepID=A0AAE0S5A5_9BIVA|nr:hypothetical protein CHS0354_020131 [Potamilus streckersoni]
MSQFQASDCNCICKCAPKDKECLPSMVENSYRCQSCSETAGVLLSRKFDPDETFPKLLDASSVDEYQDERNVTTMSGWSSPESTLYRELPSEQRRLHLFCTCSADSSYHLKQVLKLSKILENRGFEVRLDRDRNNPNFCHMRMAINMQDWLDGHIARADFVIICISPKYLKDIQANVKGSPETDTNADITRYIYDQLRAEYYINRCHHQKVIPVCFRESYVPNTKIPSFMKTTIVYTYPKDLNNLISFLNMSKNRL